MVFQLFFHFVGRSHRALGWNGSGDRRPDGQGHQGSEADAEAENASCMFQRAQKVGRTLDREAVRTESARQGCVLVVRIFSRSFDGLITCARSLGEDRWGRG